MLKHLRLAFAAALLLTTAAAARAQIAVYGNYEADRMYSKWYTGPTFGVYDDFFKLGPLHLGGDVRGSVLYGSQSDKSTRLMVGFRGAVKPPILPIKPYAEILGGYSSTGLNGISGSKHAAAEANGGVDFTFFPHLDWRIFEIGGTVANQGTDNNYHISTGLVLRFF